MSTVMRVKEKYDITSRLNIGIILFIDETALNWYKD
jgi:hypothetical protein